MARCHLCEKKLGWFSKVRRMDGQRFCRDCAIRWPEERKRRAIEQLCGSGEPNELFSIPDVKCVSPDRPKGRLVLYGNLAFTDKGVCFIQLAEAPNAEPLWQQVFEAFGAMIDERQAEKRAARALEAGRRTILERAESFADLLRRSPRLIIVPPGEIRDITYGWFSGLRIKTAKGSPRFELDRPGKTFKAYRERIGKYVHAVHVATGPEAGQTAQDDNPYRGD